jgi:hypothetical protein
METDVKWRSKSGDNANMIEILSEDMLDWLWGILSI